MNQANYRNNRFQHQQNKSNSFMKLIFMFASIFSFNWFRSSFNKLPNRTYSPVKAKDRKSYNFSPKFKSTNCALKQSFNMKKCHGHLWNGSIVEVIEC